MHLHFRIIVGITCTTWFDIQKYFPAQICSSFVEYGTLRKFIRILQLLPSFRNCKAAPNDVFFLCVFVHVTLGECQKGNLNEKSR